MSDPIQALLELNEKDFDLVLLDYHLGSGVMGDDVARQIRTRKPLLPLLMLTGDAHLPDEARQVVDGVLIKGVSNPSDLWEAVHRLVPDKPLKPRRGPFQFLPSAS